MTTNRERKIFLLKYLTGGRFLFIFIGFISEHNTILLVYRNRRRDRYNTIAPYKQINLIKTKIV